MRTGMGIEIGPPRLAAMEFIPTSRYGNRLHKFIRFVDFIDPVAGSCANPIEHRHYLIEWEDRDDTVLQWTHGANIPDHRSGMEDMYDEVTSKFYSSGSTACMRLSISLPLRESSCPRLPDFREELRKYCSPAEKNYRFEEGKEGRP